MSKPARARYVCSGAGPQERRGMPLVQESWVPGTKAVLGCCARRTAPAGTLAAPRRLPSLPASGFVWVCLSRYMARPGGAAARTLYSITGN